MLADRNARASALIPRALALAVAVAVAACSSETVVAPESQQFNAPAVGVTGQGLGFTVQASGFTFDGSYQSPTQGDSLAVGLTVTGYRGGSARLEIRDGSGATRYTLLITQGLAQGQVTVRGTPPYTVRLTFSSFSGQFALGVAAISP